MIGRPAGVPPISDELRENLVRFLERLLAPDIEPGALDLMGLHRLALVEPLDESARLVRIISRGDIGREKRHDLARKIIERNPGQRVFRLGRFLFELGDDAVGIDRDAAVFLDRLEIADVVGRQRRFGVFGGLRKIRPAVR